MKLQEFSCYNSVIVVFLCWGKKKKVLTFYLHLLGDLYWPSSQMDYFY